MRLQPDRFRCRRKKNLRYKYTNKVYPLKRQTVWIGASSTKSTTDYHVPNVNGKTKAQKRRQMRKICLARCLNHAFRARLGMDLGGIHRSLWAGRSSGSHLPVWLLRWTPGWLVSPRQNILLFRQAFVAIASLIVYQPSNRLDAIALVLPYSSLFLSFLRFEVRTI